MLQRYCIHALQRELKLTKAPGTLKDASNRHLRGELLYQPDLDVHFPHLTVDQTLTFAARLQDSSQDRAASLQCDKQALTGALGLLHVVKLKVGSEFVRGISGGERKRVSIGGKQKKSS